MGTLYQFSIVIHKDIFSRKTLTTSMATNNKINVNTAKMMELTRLHGVGPRVAERIITHRRTIGHFREKEDLLAVQGISDRILGKIKRKIILSNRSTDAKQAVEEKIRQNDAAQKKREAEENEGFIEAVKDIAGEVLKSGAIGWFTGFIFGGNDTDDLPDDRPTDDDDPRIVSGRHPKKLTAAQIINTAKRLGVEGAAIKAVVAVESSGSGFLKSGKPKILFEGHIFWRELEARLINPKRLVRGNEDILYERWTREHYRGGEGEYDRLRKAVKIHEEAALASASWGLFQVMGFNYYVSEYKSVKKFVNAQYKSEYEHLKTFIGFIESNNLVRHLRNKNWAKFAAGYNGKDYKKNNYDTRLHLAYLKYKKLGW